MAMGLRPSMLDDLGLVAAMERAIEEVQQNHAIEIALDSDGLTEMRLPESIEIAFFRIFQEAIQNIVKHSKARSGTVQLSHEHGRITLEITDDGCGIDPAILELGHAPGSHLGLLSMQERASMNAGQFHIESEPGQGTRIVATLPLDKSRA